MKRKPLLLLLAVASILLFVGIVQWLRSRGTEKAETGESAVSKGTKPNLAPLTSVTEGSEDWLRRVGDAKTADLRSLMELALRITDPTLRSLIVEAILARWIAEDTEAVLAFLDHLEVMLSSSNLEVVYAGLERVLANLHPEVALLDNVIVLVERLISYLSDKDPERALAWAEKCLLDDALENALVSVIRGTVRTNVARALEIAKKVTSELRTMQAMALIGGHWAASDSKGALSWAKTITSPGTKALTMNSILLVMAQASPAAAATELSATAGEMASEFARARRAILAENNLTEADEANSTEAYRDMLDSGSIPGPESPDVELMVDAGKVIASKMAAEDPEGATSWAEALEGGFLRSSVLAAAVETWATTNPLDALNFVNQKYPNDAPLLESVFTGWASTAPAAAAYNVNRIADPFHRTAVLNQLFAKWGNSGSAANAAAFLQQMPAASVTDQMRLSVSQGLVSGAPLEAWNVAKTIQEPNAQARAMKAALSALVFSNPGQAVEVYNTTNIPAKTKVVLGELLDSAGAR
jgi:hypothetical protein